MSYPGHIQTLIVEDEQDPINNYQALFQGLAKMDVAPPVIARSHDDAVEHLAGNSIFHLVIIDLGLPYATHEAAKAGVDPGIDLVRRAAAREHYPIPAVLVISGRLGQTQLTSLSDSLACGFWHGKMANKGVDMDEAIEKAIQEVHKYCGVGIHLRDGGSSLWPTISPREEDLLRRCVLSQTQFIGLDLEWWAEEPMTKVLMGRFLLRNGMESSRPSFFKFEPRQNAVYSHEAAEIMVQKLAHVKICGTVHSASRSLLVTQQVGGASSRPISLAEMLANNSDMTKKSIPQVASDVAGQLASLGSVTEDLVSVPKLLWPCHDLEKVKSAWKRHGKTTDGPVRLLEILRATHKPLWVQRRSCTHGDLNATNIALEAAETGYRAYIFDAAGMRPDIAGRDLAMLETTLLLHQRLPLDECLVEQCKAIYGKGAVAGELAPGEGISSAAKNTFYLIQEIRRHALKMNKQPVYALMVFDCAMIQLGGLAIQSRQNKISHPASAVKLAEFVAEWLLSIAPDLATVPITQ